LEEVMKIGLRVVVLLTMVLATISANEFNGPLPGPPPSPDIAALG
jgi:hypothetical protein